MSRKKTLTVQFILDARDFYLIEKLLSFVLDYLTDKCCTDRLNVKLNITRHAYAYAYMLDDYLTNFS